MSVIRKQIMLDKESIAILEKIKKDTGSNHSEIIRRALKKFDKKKKSIKTRR